jgi:sec-independent protein translocase protein TatC
MPQQHDAGFLGHLEELRTRIIQVLLVFVVGSAVAFFQLDHLMPFLRNPIKDFPVLLNYFRPEEKMLLHMKVSFFIGFLVSVPFIFFHLWKFILPALHSNEKPFWGGALLWGFLLFCVGCLLSWKTITPFTFSFLIRFAGDDGINQMWGMTSYYDLLMTLVLLTGSVMELPLMLLTLIKLGIVRVAALERLRRQVLVAVAILMALFTADLFSLVFLTVLLYLLFEATLLIGRLFGQKNRV